jgi:hypothetical protein
MPRGELNTEPGKSRSP